MISTGNVPPEVAMVKYGSGSSCDENAQNRFLSAAWIGKSTGRTLKARARGLGGLELSGTLRPRNQEISADCCGEKEMRENGMLVKAPLTKEFSARPELMLSI